MYSELISEVENMTFLVILFAVIALVCAVVILKININAPQRTIRFLIALMLCSLVISATFMFMSDFKERIITNMFSSQQFTLSQNGEKYTIPLPKGSAAGSDKIENGKRYITQATSKQIESFYKNIADEESYASIKSGGVERISLEYKGKKFLIKHSKYKGKYRYLDIETVSD